MQVAPDELVTRRLWAAIAAALIITTGLAVAAYYRFAIWPNEDHDSDGLANGWERKHGLQPKDASDAMLDHDLDGLSTRYEHDHGTHPFHADPDGDGISDYDDLLPYDGAALVFSDAFAPGLLSSLQTVSLVESRSTTTIKQLDGEVITPKNKEDIEFATSASADLAEHFARRNIESRFDFIGPTRLRHERDLGPWEDSTHGCVTVLWKWTRCGEFRYAGKEKTYEVEIGNVEMVSRALRGMQRHYVSLPLELSAEHSTHGTTVRFQVVTPDAVEFEYRLYRSNEYSTRSILARDSVSGTPTNTSVWTFEITLPPTAASANPILYLEPFSPGDPPLPFDPARLHVTRLTTLHPILARMTLHNGEAPPIVVEGSSPAQVQQRAAPHLASMLADGDPLETLTQTLEVVQLATSVGVIPDPGISASTYTRAGRHGDIVGSEFAFIAKDAGGKNTVGTIRTEISHSPQGPFLSVKTTTTHPKALTAEQEAILARGSVSRAAGSISGIAEITQEGRLAALSVGQGTDSPTAIKAAAAEASTRLATRGAGSFVKFFSGSTILIGGAEVTGHLVDAAFAKGDAQRALAQERAWNALVTTTIALVPIVGDAILLGWDLTAGWRAENLHPLHAAIWTTPGTLTDFMARDRIPIEMAEIANSQARAHYAQLAPGAHVLRTTDVAEPRSAEDGAGHRTPLGGVVLLAMVIAGAFAGRRRR